MVSFASTERLMGLVVRLNNVGSGCRAGLSVASPPILQIVVPFAAPFVAELRGRERRVWEAFDSYACADHAR